MASANTHMTTYPSLKGRSVMITGRATGIGAAMVLAFAGQGARVGFIDIDAAAGASLAANVQQAGGAAPWFRVVDVTQIDRLKGAIADFAAGGGLDVLVNNVADDTRHDPLQTNEAAWRGALAINLDAAFFASQTAIALMSATGGAIINLSSINALTGPPSMPAYVASKAALLGLTKALAREYGPRGVRVNAILPGWVVTERQLRLWLTPEAEAAWMKDTPLKRRILPDDVARLALFLGSDDSAMITGQQFVIDGGRT